MTVGGHFERVAAVYDSLRTTDEAPVRRIGQFLPDRPVTGLWGSKTEHRLLGCEYSCRHGRWAGRIAGS